VCIYRLLDRPVHNQTQGGIELSYRRLRSMKKRQKQPELEEFSKKYVVLKFMDLVLINGAKVIYLD
jgi:hypothetical protein